MRNTLLNLLLNTSVFQGILLAFVDQLVKYIANISFYFHQDYKLLPGFSLYLHHHN